MTGWIGLVGGYGAVGSVAAQQLHAWGVGPLRVGGRDGTRADRLAASLRASATEVDVVDPASLARFCAGCSIVLDCTGPAYLIRDRVLRAAFAAGADYVGTAGDLPDDGDPELDLAGTGRTALFAAGIVPGLSGLLPRYLATHLPAKGAALTAYVGGRDRFTLSGAADYLAGGAGFGEPRAAWRAGTRVARALHPVHPLVVPYFPDPVTAQPYLSAETERVARDLELSSVYWYHLFTGTHLLAALRRLADTPPDRYMEAAAQLCRAAELDLFGREPYHRFVLELVRPDTTVTLVLRGTGATALTGVTAALAVRAVADHAVPAGRHAAADVLDPSRSVELLVGTAAVDGLQVFDGPADGVEEGVL